MEAGCLSGSRGAGAPRLTGTQRGWLPRDTGRQLDKWKSPEPLVSGSVLGPQSLSPSPSTRCFLPAHSLCPSVSLSIGHLWGSGQGQLQAQGLQIINVIWVFGRRGPAGE